MYYRLKRAKGKRTRRDNEAKNFNFVQLYKEHLKDLRALAQQDKNALTLLLIMI